MKGQSKDDVMEEAKKVLKIVSDYWSEPSVEHIEEWLEQFDEDVRLELISEMRKILSQTYFSASRVERFLKGLISASKLVGKDAGAFWKKANFFKDQRGGQSQGDMLVPPQISWTLN